MTFSDFMTKSLWLYDFEAVDSNSTKLLNLNQDYPSKNL